MADDLKPLIVAVEASLTKFNKQMAMVAKTGADSAKAIDKSFTTANENIANSFTKSGQKAVVSLGQQKAAVTNLSFQLNDLASGLMSGTSPFTLMAQQGSQVAQALQSSGGGIKGLLGTIGGAAGAVLNPLSLATFAVIGLGAAAIDYFSGLISGSKLSKEELAHHEEAIRKIADAYRSVLPEFARWVDAQEAAKTAASNQAQLDASRADALKEQRTLLQQLQDVTSTASNRGAAVLDPDAAKNLEAVNAEVDAYVAKVNAGAGSTKELEAVVQDVLKAISDVAGQPGFDDLNDKAKELSKTLAKTAADTEVVKKAQEDLGNLPDPKKLAEYNDAMAKLKQIAPDAIDKQKEAFDLLLIAIEKAQTAQQRLTAEYEYGARTAKLQEQAVNEFGQTLASGTDDYKRIVGQAESGNNPGARPRPGSKSTVSGQFQFTDKTFLDTVRKFNLVPKEISDSMIMAQKNNQAFQEKAFDALTQGSINALAQAGIDTQSTLNKYALHLLGEQGGLALLRAPKDQPVSQFLSRDAISGNPGLLGGGKNAAQALAAIQAFLAKADRDSSTGGKSFQGSIQGLKDQTAELEAAAKAEGNLGTAIDDRTYKMVKAEEVTKLTADAKKDGIALDQETVAAIDATADAYARAKASNVGYKQSLDATAQAGKDSIAAQKRLAEQAARTAEQFAGMATGFVMGFISDLKSGKSATEALTDALSRLADQLLDMALNSLFKMIFSQIFGGGTGGGGGIGGLLAGILHEGGTAGSAGKTRQVSSLAFVGAPRYHTGGVAGFKPGEIPAVLQRGEVVLPRGFKGNGGGDTTTISNAIGGITIDMGSTGLVASDSQKGARFGKIVQEIIRNEMVNQSRPGGLLTQTGSAGRIGR